MKGKCWLFFSIFFIIIGALFVVVNCIGIFVYTTITPENRNLSVIDKTQISVAAFYQNVPRKSGESDQDYAARMTKLVDDRLIPINNKFTKPTFFENWIVYLFANYKGNYEWNNTDKIVRLGGGFCSQHSILLNNLMSDVGIKSRILRLNGHVVTDIFYDGKFHVHDPLNNTVFEESLMELTKKKDVIYDKYRASGSPESEAKYFVAVFESESDNSITDSSFTYWREKSAMEAVSFYLIWIIPALLVFFGIFISIKHFWSKRRALID